MARGVSTPPPALASAYELFTAEALEAHKLYVGEVRHPVEVPGIERAHAVQWLSKRLNTALSVPNLEEIQLKLVGARLLPGPTGPAAFFMYEGPSGERFTLYCGTTTAGQTAMRYHDGRRRRRSLGRPQPRLCDDWAGRSRAVAQGLESDLRPDREQDAGRCREDVKRSVRPDPSVDRRAFDRATCA